MSNLSELLPAGAGAKSADFVASGTLSSGQVVILNANGQVGAVSGSGAVTGSETVFEAATTRYVSSAYDTTTDRVVIAYADGGNSYHGTAIVGTVSGTTISFGTAVVFETAEVQDVALTFDNNSNKIVIAYADEGNSSHGTAIVGTVSGTSISFGSAVVFAASNIDDIANTFDSNSNKVVIAYSNLGNSKYGTAIVGTVSGTSISFGTAVVFGSSNISNLQLAFDPNSNKVVIAYRDITNSQYGYAIIGTVSGTAISFGTAVVVLADASKDFNTPVIDSTNNKVIISYANGGNSTKAEARVGTISGTSISFGTAVVFSSGTADFYTGGAYHAGLQKVVLAYRDDTSGTLTGKYNVGTVSGTDISFSGEVIFNSGRADNISLVYDPDSTNLVNSFEDNANSSYGTSQVFSPSTLNLTSTNFIGITDAAIADTATGAVIVKGGVITNSNLFPSVYTGSVGSEVVFEAARADHAMPIFDSSNNKVVIIYADNGDSSHGKAIVGTVSGSSISYGTAVTFNAATTTRISGTFDSNSNKVVIAFGDDGDSSKVKSIVGTVSGTSISFGSEATITTNTTGVSTTTTFDSNSNKVVVFYRDDGNSEYGTAAVGTVSGTSISFGTPVVFESASTGIVQSSSTFDTSANKTVVAYRDVGNSSHGTAIVGTVSGTSISFGTVVAFHAATTEETMCAFDSGNNKVVVAYRDNAAPKALASRVGTVSGTGISFGTEATVQTISAYTAYSAMAYSPDSQRVVIVYMNGDNSSYGTYALGSVSGTDITYDTPVVFAAASTEDCGIAYDTNADKFVVSFKDTANSNHGTSVVLTLTGTVPALTIGTDYFVQSDGTLSTTSSTVPAGRALSTTSILLEG